MTLLTKKKQSQIHRKWNEITSNFPPGGGFTSKSSVFQERGSSGEVRIGMNSLPKPLINVFTFGTGFATIYNETSRFRVWTDGPSGRIQAPLKLFRTTKKAS